MAYGIQNAIKKAVCRAVTLKGCLGIGAENRTIRGERGGVGGGDDTLTL